MNQSIQLVILGLTLGGVYALMASGLTLIFGVMGIVNLAHASFMVLAAFIAFRGLQISRPRSDPLDPVRHAGDVSGRRSSSTACSSRARLPIRTSAA